MNKIAVGLFGIHYCESFNHWMGWVHNIDYSKTIENNKNKIYQYYDVDYYTSTYYSNVLDTLITNYNFEAIKLKNISNIKEADIKLNYVKRNKIFKETLELIIASNKIYDYVILTRYDCMFLQTIDNLNIKNNKINFLCKSKCGNESGFADDNFYIIPYRKLEYFYKIISNINENSVLI